MTAKVINDEKEVRNTGEAGKGDVVDEVGVLDDFLSEEGLDVFEFDPIVIIEHLPQPNKEHLSIATQLRTS